jgi:hypothetical protein
LRITVELSIVDETMKVSCPVCAEMLDANHMKVDIAEIERWLKDESHPRRKDWFDQFDDWEDECIAFAIFQRRQHDLTAEYKQLVLMGRETDFVTKRAESDRLPPTISLEHRDGDAERTFKRKISLATSYGAPSIAKAHSDRAGIELRRLKMHVGSSKSREESSILHKKTQSLPFLDAECEYCSRMTKTLRSLSVLPISSPSDEDIPERMPATTNFFYLNSTKSHRKTVELDSDCSPCSRTGFSYDLREHCTCFRRTSTYTTLTDDALPDLLESDYRSSVTTYEDDPLKRYESSSAGVLSPIERLRARAHMSEEFHTITERRSSKIILDKDGLPEYVLSLTHSTTGSTTNEHECSVTVTSTTSTSIRFAPIPPRLSTTDGTSVIAYTALELKVSDNGSDRSDDLPPLCGKSCTPVSVLELALRRSGSGSLQAIAEEHSRAAAAAEPEQSDKDGHRMHCNCVIL